MPSWFWISFAIILLISFLAFLFFYREVKTITKSQIRVLGGESKEIILTGRLKIFLLLYFISILMISIVSLAFFQTLS